MAGTTKPVNELARNWTEGGAPYRLELQVEEAKELMHEVPCK